MLGGEGDGSCGELPQVGFAGHAVAVSVEVQRIARLAAIDRSGTRCAGLGAGAPDPGHWVWRLPRLNDWAGYKMVLTRLEGDGEDEKCRNGY